MLVRIFCFRSLWFFCGFFLVGFGISASVSSEVLAHPSVFIKLNIQEALPGQEGTDAFKPIKGVDRVKEPVTIGLPLHFDSNLLLVEQLLLVGSNDFQYRILKKWSNERIKWILVDMLADVKANEVKGDAFLTAGTGIVPPTKLATEENDFIKVDTGAAKFSLRKKGYNLFDSVSVKGTELIKSGHTSGVVLTAMDDTLYVSHQDQQSTAEISHNGPVRSVVKVTGLLTDSNKKTHLGYTLRLHFYKGKSRVRAVFSLRNASKSLVEHVKFKSLELVLQSNMTKPSYQVATHEDGQPKTGALATTSKLRLFQGQNNFPTIQEKGFDESIWPTGLKGYKLTLDGKDEATGTSEQPIRLFYLQAASSGNAITVGTRFAAGYWPQGLGVDGDGTLRVGLYPTGNDRTYVIRYNSHQTHEVMFFFGTDKESARDEFFKFQYPLFARPQDVDWYNQVESWKERFVSFKEESDYYKSKKWPTDSHPLATDKRQPSFAVIRHWDASALRKPEAYLRAYTAFSNALRQPEVAGGAYFLMAEQWVRYFADVGVYHSDDYDAAKVLDEVPLLKDSSGLLKPLSTLPNADALPSTPTLWNQDFGAPSLFQKWYYSFGDERVRSAYVDWGEYLLFLKAEPTTARQLGQWLLRLSNLFKLTNNTAFQKKAWGLIDKYIVQTSAKVGESWGFDRQRGFYVGSSQATSTDRTFSMGASAGILLRGLASFESYGAASEQQASATRDLIDGLSRYVAGELFLEYGAALGDFGFPFEMSLDKPLQDLRNSEAWGKGLAEAFLGVAGAFLMSNQESFLLLGEKLLQLTAENTAQLKGFGDLPSRQTLQYMVENPLLFPTWRDLPLQAKKLSDGRYRLTWIAPYNPTKFWFKMATKPIVSSLAYDPKTQSFGTDPSTSTTFFAATFVDQQPNIVDPGLNQAMFVKVPDPAKDYYFAARFLSTDPRKPPREPFGENPMESVPVQDGGEPSTIPETSTIDVVSGTESQTDVQPELAVPPSCGCQQSGPSSWLSLGGLFLFLLGLRRRKTTKSM